MASKVLSKCHAIHVIPNDLKASPCHMSGATIQPDEHQIGPQTMSSELFTLHVDIHRIIIATKTD